MTQVCEAVCEKGVLKPVGAPFDLRDGQHVNVVINDAKSDAKKEELDIWLHGLEKACRELRDSMSDAEMDELEKAMLGNSHYLIELQ